MQFDQIEFVLLLHRRRKNHLLGSIPKLVLMIRAPVEARKSSKNVAAVMENMIKQKKAVFGQWEMQCIPLVEYGFGLVYS